MSVFGDTSFDKGGSLCSVIVAFPGLTNFFIRYFTDISDYYNENLSIVIT